MKPESQLWYVRQGKSALYINIIAMKEKKLEDDFVKEWTEVFKKSEVTDLKKETKDNKKN
jgi:ABC-type metal ion transport system substrate-binding protein